MRNAYYASSRGVRQVPKPVIAVGNITVGGTGKTPLVTWIVRRLRREGYVPAIVMRGYAAVDPTKADEALEYRDILGEVDIVVGADRYASIMSYLKGGGQADCFVMDDGFQHRKLHRDLDIVVLDFLRDAFEDHMLPLGWLREPVSGLVRADAFVVSHAQKVDQSYANKVELLTGKKPVAWTSHHWTNFLLFTDEGATEESLDWITGRSLALRLGIGHPRPVIEALVRLGAKISLQLPAGDHQSFSETEIETFVRTADAVDAIVMTMKDWVKARDVIDLSRMNCPIVVPVLDIELLEGEEDLEKCLMSVFKIG